ncbi:hypothetical protein U9M48_042607 [Paspalum notatum var. saurae]|uniref:Reverse transcriptase Ty1/copia-type domain-containing protein n=1 Tax=Paspalum notatum var. saurae TaxID=547442 RepID=A0AAQ3UV56_PASNO
MTEEYQALIDNNTWRNVVTGKWIFKHKFHANGSLARHKARWVVRGFSRRHGIDYDETFSPVVKPATIRVVLGIAVSRREECFSSRQLGGIYRQQPPGFIDPTAPNHVCLLRKSLYGLKRAPGRGTGISSRIFGALVLLRRPRTPPSSCTRRAAILPIYLLYVDDIILTASSYALLRSRLYLHSEFAMTDLGALHHFLGISVTRSSDGFFGDAPWTYYGARAWPSLSRYRWSFGCRPFEYRGLAGALRHSTRPDIAYAVRQVRLFMHDPREPHLALIKRICAMSRALFPRIFSAVLNCILDAGGAGCPDSRRSTSGYCVFLGDNLVSWSSKRRITVSRSGCSCRCRELLATSTSCRASCLYCFATIVYRDNVSAVYMTGNPVHHRRTKHIEIDIHFVCEKVALGQVRVLHVPSSHQFADIMTKGLHRTVVCEFRSGLCVRDPPAATAGGY